MKAPIRSEHEADEMPTKTTTIIVGDSIIAKLEGWKMSNKNNRVLLYQSLFRTSG